MESRNQRERIGDLQQELINLKPVHLAMRHSARFDINDALKRYLNDPVTITTPEGDGINMYRGV